MKPIRKTLDLLTKDQALNVIPQICEVFKITQDEIFLVLSIHYTVKIVEKRAQPKKSRRK